MVLFRRTSILALLLVGVAAPPAAAHHSASATASLALDPPGAACRDSERSHRSRCDGSRVARVTWSVSCAYRSFTQIQVWAVRAGGGAPIPLATEDGPENAASGVTSVRLEPGQRVFATVTVDCLSGARPG